MEWRRSRTPSDEEREEEGTAVRRRVFVSGRVQGVFYRDSLRTVATREGVRGWARNLPDGRVEAVLEGEPVAVARVIAWCRAGPSRAYVTGLDVEEEPIEAEAGFTVR